MSPPLFELICRSGDSAARQQEARFRIIVATAWGLLTPATRRTLRKANCRLYLADLVFPKGQAGMTAYYLPRHRLVVVNAYSLAKMSSLAAVTVLVHELFHAWAHARRLPYYKNENKIDRLTEEVGLPMQQVRAFVTGRGKDPGRPSVCARTSSR